VSAGADDRIGSAAEEAARLIDAVSGRTDDCAWCPLCRAAAFLRDTDPEVRARVVSSATALMVSLRDLADSAARPPAPRDESDQPADDQWE
jgi:hypothetical protein